MRAPTWESSPGALAAFLNSSTQCYMADLYTITLSGGAQLRYTSADAPVTVNGTTFGLGPGLQRGKTKVSLGIAVDTLSLTVAADSGVTVNGVAMLPFLAGGGLDAASLRLERAFARAPGAAWVGTVGLFSGRVTDVQTSRSGASVTVSSESELLNVMVPRNVYQPSCSNTLFDSTCGLSKLAAGVGAAASVGTQAARNTFTTSTAFADGTYSQGFAVGVAGANEGVGRTIKAQKAGVITTIQPWPSPVAVGDTFTLYPGCDKTQGTCSAKFNNLVHFRGQPYVPAPESIA